MKWGPIAEARRAAKVSRGMYLCASCNKVVPTSLPPPPGQKKRLKNVFVDHKVPIIDPAVGFESWDRVIAALFCELDNLEVLCGVCHAGKTTAERDIATERRRREKADADR